MIGGIVVVRLFLFFVFSRCWVDELRVEFGIFGLFCLGFCRNYDRVEIVGAALQFVRY